MKKIIIALLLVSVLSGGGFWYVRSVGQRHTTFRTVAVERGTLQATISATGTVEPEEVIDVGAQVIGQIKSFGPDPNDKTKTKRIDYGSEVQEGTVLAQIDEALYQAQLDQATANVVHAEADLLQMKAKLRQTERDWNRAKQLSGRTQGVISDLDYDTTLAAYETAKSTLAVGEATIAQAKAAQKQAEINRAYTTIKSPVKGVIIDRRVNIGQTVVANLNAPSLFLIAKDLRKMEIWASVNEADIGQIKPGQHVTFTVDAFAGETFNGVVSQIRLNATMNQNVVTYTVTVTTDNSSKRLLPYMTANLQFQVQQRTKALKVPNAALRWTPQTQEVAPEARQAFITGQRLKNPSPGSAPAPTDAAKKERHDHGTLWVADGDYVKPVKVRVGLSDGNMTEVMTDQIEEGDQVVAGEVHQGAGGDTSNPFTPQLFGGRKKES
ncbi:MAG TPA: efflux RND transporter periplasmic adaptor subunit [Gemmataceae bacterium]|jgi:HlyD family secretion protein|nr:efflux RND transporter periplasmic adaptor subunit [Gemmataceae bacterium]